MSEIKGYRKLDEETIELINHIKEAELEVGGVWRFIKNTQGVDQRFVNIARTHFEEGFSALVRSVAKPRSAFTYED